MRVFGLDARGFVGGQVIGAMVGSWFGTFLSGRSRASALRCRLLFASVRGRFCRYAVRAVDYRTFRLMLRVRLGVCPRAVQALFVIGAGDPAALWQYRLPNSFTGHVGRVRRAGPRWLWRRIAQLRCMKDCLPDDGPLFVLCSRDVSYGMPCRPHPWASCQLRGLGFVLAIARGIPRP